MTRLAAREAFSLATWRWVLRRVPMIAGGLAVTLALAAAVAEAGLDSGFGKNGVVSLPPHAATTLLVRGDGEVVVAGTGDCGRGGTDFVVRRLHRDGSPDPSFGRNGRACHDSGRLGDEELHDAALRPGGGLLLVGGIHRARVSIMALHSNGRLDRSFGRGGRVVLDLTHDNLEEAYRVAFTAGEAVIAAVRGGSSDFFELHRDGRVDESFASGGSVLLRVSPHVAVQSNGRIVVGGGYQFRMARLMEDGTVDSGFGGDGFASIGRDRAPIGHDLVIQPDGRILDPGEYLFEPYFLSLRYRRNGQVDRSFGTNGRVRTDIHREAPDGSCSSGDSAAQAVRLTPGGKLVVAGSVMTYRRSSCVRTMGVVRYLADGSVDSTFSQEGQFISPRGLIGRGFEPVSLAIDARRYLVGGPDGTLIAVRGG